MKATVIPIQPRSKANAGFREFKESANKLAIMEKAIALEGRGWFMSACRLLIGAVEPTGKKIDKAELYYLAGKIADWNNYRVASAWYGEATRYFADEDPRRYVALTRAAHYYKDSVWPDIGQRMLAEAEMIFSEHSTNKGYRDGVLSEMVWLSVMQRRKTIPNEEKISEAQ
ncbi:hypothetical protein KJ780_02595 [Candidatus Micrarchaeota archaeon]|nr:hypothetical protein [Candidatus Micrarchaeota archaeon]